MDAQIANETTLLRPNAPSKGGYRDVAVSQRDEGRDEMSLKGQLSQTAKGVAIGVGPV